MVQLQNNSSKIRRRISVLVFGMTAFMAMTFNFVSLFKFQNSVNSLYTLYLPPEDFAEHALSASALKKNRKAKPENRSFTRRQHQKNDCYEAANEFDFPEHGCNVMNSRVHCHFSSLRLNTSKIISQARGGEPLQSVLGQAENAEVLSYRPGAFSVARPFENIQSNKHFYHYMSNVLGSLQVNTLSDEKELEPCSTTWKGTTLFLTRYEYVNLYHTLTDWWNTFYSLPTKNGTNVLDLPINIVLLDAHPQGNLDSVWQTLLGGNVAYARHLQDELVCFETARFVPAGYTSPLYPGHTNCPKGGFASGQGSAFVDFFLSTYHLKDVKRIPGRGTLDATEAHTEGSVVSSEPFVTPVFSPSLHI
jgi:hypothetical protein